MLLQRLAEYAARNGGTVPFHRSRLLSWSLDLDDKGRPLSNSVQPLALPDDTAGKRLTGVPHTVPSTVRTAGVAANLAADDVQYVLGWGDADSKPARVAQCLQAFADLTQRWADSDAGRTDDIAQAVAAFYRSGALASLTRPPDCAAKHGVLITVGGRPVYQAPSVVEFWSTEVARRKGGGSSGLCLVCGTMAPLLDTVPGKVPSRLVPGTTNDAALVSVNERVFGYDLTTQLACSPVCISCGEAVAAGLAGVLGSRHSTAYGGQDSRTAWWVTQDSPFDVMTMLERPDPDDVNRLLRSVRTGQRPAAVDGSFFSLTVGGNVARVMVRSWVEMPLPQVESNVADWFDDLDMTPLWPEGRRQHSLGALTLAAGRWLRDRKRYAEFGAKGADRPDGVHRDLLRVALYGHVLPPSLLIHLIHRVHTDGHLDDARAALLRLALLRSPTISENPMPGLDTDNTNPAYVAGRVFAALDALQYDASGGALNATYADRYFSGAISNPRAALLHGRRSANAWLHKLRRGPRKGAAVNHEKTLDELFNLLTAELAIPARTTPAQQALFMLGYHHQRAHRMAAIAAAKAAHSSEERSA